MSADPDVGAVQYRVVVGKRDELIDGPDDADVVVKSTGSTGALFVLLRSGAAAEALSRLAHPASRP